MKVSEITVENLRNYVREDSDDENTITSFQMMLNASKAYIKSYTGLSDEQLDENEDLTIVVFVLVSDMYDNRTYSVQNDKVNKVVSTILNMHSRNLL